MGREKQLPIATQAFDRHIRGIPADLWQAARVAAVRREVTLGAIITEALRKWLDRQPKEANDRESKANS